MAKYRVAWKHKTKNLSGHGSWQTCKEAVEAAVKNANLEWPEIEHWVEES